MIRQLDVSCNVMTYLQFIARPNLIDAQQRQITDVSRTKERGILRTNRCKSVAEFVPHLL